MRKLRQEEYAYDARVALWPSSDPIGENGGVSLCGMVRNNPISYLDYLGLACCTEGEKRNWKAVRAEKTLGNSFAGDVANEIISAGSLLASALIVTGGAPLTAPLGNGAYHLGGEIVLAVTIIGGSEVAGLPDQSRAINNMPVIIRNRIDIFNAVLRLSREITVKGKWKQCVSSYVFWTRREDRGGHTHVASGSILSGGNFSAAILSAKAFLYGN